MLHKLSKQTSIGLLVGLLLVTVPAYAVKNYKTSNFGGAHQIWFEAEDFDERNPASDQYYAIADQTGAFGQAINRPSGAGGMIRWTFDIGLAGGQGGTWYFWARQINPNNQSDYMLVQGDPGDPQIPTGPPFPGGDAVAPFDNADDRVFEENVGTLGAWAWGLSNHEEGHTKELQNGQNTMYIFHRSGNNTVFWDVFVWTDSASYVPTDADYQNATVAPRETTATSPSPRNGATVEATWASLAWTPATRAVSHNVYLGDKFEDVSAGTGNTFQGNLTSAVFVAGLGMPGDPYPGGLVPGATYYWRIDEVNPADPNSPWKGEVWSFSVPSRKAYQPTPAGGAKYQDPGVVLKWTPGLSAKLHYVFFGDNFDTITNATVGAPQAAASYTPTGPLVKGKTYFWRIDEFDGAARHKGDVWSFTTMPDIPVSDPNLVAWYKSDVGEGTRVIDFSGHGNHGTIVPGSAGTVQRVPTLFDMGLEFLGDNQGHVELPPGIMTTAKGSVLMWINTTQGDAANNDEGMLWWASQTVAGDGYGGENEIHINIDDPGNGQLDFFLEEDGAGSDITINGPDVGGTGWKHVAATWDLTDGCRLYVDGLEVGSAAHNTNVKSFAVMRLGRPVSVGSGNCYYDGLMDDVRLFNHAISAAKVAEIMSKGEDPLRAGAVNPTNGSLTPINQATPLSWSPGEKASQHDVYFGLDRAVVADANASDTTGVYRGRQSTTSYTPPEGVQMASGPYYWRIDEVNTDGTITVGAVWSFSTADYVVVEDFESYNEIQTGQPGSHMIYDTWLDGFTNPAANGSTMGYTVPFQPTMESGIVHGGRQSAPMTYNNTAAARSEVTRTFVVQNWTANGIQTLSLWFFGASANVPGQLYAKVNGVKVAYDGNADNLKAPAWQVWNINLASVGTNLQSVTTLAIGVEGSGATGTLLLDDIRLYRQADAPLASGVVEVPRTSVAPVIDGQWDTLWNAVPETRCLITKMINTSSITPEDANDLSAVFKAAYDDSNFYIFVEVRDSVIDTSFSDHQGDGVEIYFDGDLSRGSAYDGVNDNQIRITAADVVLADTTSSLAIDGTVFQVLQTGVGYNIEASFPLARLQIIPLAPNKIIGFEVQINDNDNSGGRQTLLRWYSDDNDSYRNASLFGVARLVSRVVGN